MPDAFALNEATEYINPTKALEYMATARPIVSTPVEDVVLQFSAVVKISKSSEDFVRLCTEAAQKPDETAVKRGLALAERNSWESIVDAMDGHIKDALAAKEPAATSGVA